MTSAETHVSIVGLPASGKTTLLAALWHVVREPGAPTALKFDRLCRGSYEHLNALAQRWRLGKIQPRTQHSGAKTVTMRLKDASARPVDLSFPDLPGEDFGRMWERREVDRGMVENLTARAVVLLVNGDTIRMPAWVVDRAALGEKTGLVPADSVTADWTPNLAPTQVKLVDLLQMLMVGELDVGRRRLALLVSAWDKVVEEELSPEALLEAKLPLLNQYLRSARDPWEWRIWGVSAQGGVYEDPDKNEHLQETDALRELERPSDRIQVVDGAEITTDITKPFAWLAG